MPPSLPLACPHHLVQPFRLGRLPLWLPNPLPLSPAQGSLGSGIQRPSVPPNPHPQPWANHFTSLCHGFLDNKTGVTIMPSSLACFEGFKSKILKELKPLISVGVSPHSRVTPPLSTCSWPQARPPGVPCAQGRKLPAMERGPHAGH